MTNDHFSDIEAIAVGLESVPLSGHDGSARDLIRRIPNSRQVILATVVRALGAQRRVFEKGSSEPKLEPDYRTQVDAAKLLLAYLEGLPTQTTVSVTVPADQSPQGSLDEHLERSPALRHSLERALAKTAKRVG